MTEGNNAKARQMTHGLIQGYIGSDHKVIDMKAFFSALWHALRDARCKSFGGEDQTQFATAQCLLLARSRRAR